MSFFEKRYQTDFVCIGVSTGIEPPEGSKSGKNCTNINSHSY